MIAEVERRDRSLWTGELAQAQGNTVRMGATVLQRLLHRLLNHRHRVLTAQLQDGDELPHATTVRPLLFQITQELLEDRWPGFTPTTDRLGMLKGAGALLQRGPGLLKTLRYADRIFSIFRGEGLQCQGGTAFS